MNLFSIEQLSATWFQGSIDPLKGASRRLRSLEAASLIHRAKAACHPLLPLSDPIFTWFSEEPEPNFGAISHRLQSRWTEALKPTTLFCATPKAIRRYGGKGKRLSPVQATHDIHVAAIYLRLLRDRPQEARAWVSEATLTASRRNQKLPDAEIHNGAGEPVLVIEFGGSYTAERVQRIHEDCVLRETAYELW